MEAQFVNLQVSPPDLHNSRREGSIETEVSILGLPIRKCRTHLWNAWLAHYYSAVVCSQQHLSCKCLNHWPSNFYRSLELASQLLGQIGMWKFLGG